MVTGQSEATLIQCTNTKREEPCPAKEMYEPSGYFCDMRAWAESRDQPWYILSAKYGLLRPWDQIEPYDERGIGESQAAVIADELVDEGYGVIHITAGRDYTDHLVPELERRGIDVVNHFAGERIGKRRQLLQQDTE